jgi:hypothetical protein
MENESLQFALREVKKQGVKEYKEALAAKIDAMISSDKEGKITAQTIVFQLQNDSL